MIWHPRHSPFVMPLVAVKPTGSPGEQTFDLSRFPAKTATHVVSGERQNLLLRSEGLTLQFDITGADVTRPVRLLADPIWSANLVKPRLLALEGLNRFAANLPIPGKLIAPDPRGRRLRFVLRALDGSLAGARHREIASHLLGHDRVEGDWNDPGNHLRDRIRRAIHRGRALMKGGYKALLK